MEDRIKALEEITQRHDAIMKQCRIDCVERDKQLARGDALFDKIQGHMDSMDYNINAVSAAVERLLERLEDFLELLDGIELIGKILKCIKRFTVHIAVIVTSIWVFITHGPDVIEAIKKWFS